MERSIPNLRTRFFPIPLMVMASHLLSAQGFVQLDLINTQAASKMGYYSPIQLELSSTKPLTLRQLPQNLKAPLYGILPLKSEGGRRFHVTLDDPDSTQAVLYVAEMRRLYQELKKEFDKEPKRKSRSFRMVLANAVLAMCRAKKSRIGDEFQIVIYGRREQGWKLEIPDYALDMHTGRGRNMKRGADHFWSEGVKLDNESRIRNTYTEEAVKIRTKKGVE